MHKPEFVTTTKDNVSPVTGKVVCKIARSRNHDLVSGGFLAVTAAGLVLLCSSLLAFAFS